MATQSMASLLSASLPAAAPTAVQVQQNQGTKAPKDQIPADLKGGLDVEAAIPINTVEVDSMVSFPVWFKSLGVCVREPSHGRGDKQV
jgi:hypothetical protein